MTSDQQAHKKLRDAYWFPGLHPSRTITRLTADPSAIVVPLHRRKKTACGACGRVDRRCYDRRPRLISDLPCGDLHVFLAVDVCRVHGAACDGVKQERIP